MPIATAPVLSGVKVAMLGSCVAQQVLETMGLPRRRLAASFARMSLASVTPPAGAMPVVGLADLDALEIEPKVRAWLAAEVTKSVPSLLGAAKPDVLVIDLLEERFDLIEADGGFVFTESQDFVASGLADLPALRQARRIPRLSEEGRWLWEAGLLRLKQALDAALPACRIVLVGAFWAAEFRTAAGLDRVPDDTTIMAGRQVSRAAHATLLDRCTDRFLATFPDALLLKAPAGTLLADPDHRWGPSPFHYVQGFYDTIAAQLRETIEFQDAAS